MKSAVRNPKSAITIAPTRAIVWFPAVSNPGETFAQLIGAILERYSMQNARPAPSPAEANGIGARLWTLVRERGLPRPLSASEQGEPGEMPDEEVTPLVDRVLAGSDEASRKALAAPVRQLVKACFYPEFKKCRDSFREIAADGSCRRQELSRTRLRVSGAHCIDCPHWVALEPEQHVKFLAKNWRSNGAGEFRENLGVFLPEDFRVLRNFLYAQARIGI